MYSISHLPLKPQFVLLAALTLLLVGIPGSTAAQDRGNILGSVQDANTGVGLAGVTVIVENLGVGDLTDAEGEFSIRGIPAGEHTLAFQMLGYRTVRQQIAVRSGESATVTVELQTEVINLGEVLAEADRPYSTASSAQIRTFDILTRPTRTSQDLLTLVPGLVTAQHAGGGKAEQIFLRGFDADHGTDVAVSVDGVPVNMVSHGHGQGYADLHFLLPDVVEKIDVSKGPYDVRFGNLSTAGGVAFTTKDHLDNNLLRVEAGQFNTRSVTALYSLPVTAGSHQGVYVAGQFNSTDGPVESPQGFQRLNIFGKLHSHLNDTDEITMSISGFSSAWNASGQIPARAVASGAIDRFGSLDDLEGGTTGRQDLNISYHNAHDNKTVDLVGYASRYSFKLFSNFTYFLDDPVNGDMIEQTDDRSLFGMEGRFSQNHVAFGLFGKATLGGGFRSDDANVTLWKSPERVRKAQLVNADVFERNLYMFAQEELIPTSFLRLQLAIRGDYFTFNVDDKLEGLPSDLPHASGYAHHGIVSPKANVVLSPLPTLDVFANFGTSFHSNDARAVVQGRRVSDLYKVYLRQGLTSDAIFDSLSSRSFDAAQRNIGTLPRAIGKELGLRFSPGSHVNFAAAVWMLDLENEFVYVGDGGFTELSGQTRRYGIDIEGRFAVNSWLTADSDINVSKGRFVDEPPGADEIPLAPRLTSTGGLTALHPSGLRASLRYRHIGARPANETGSVTAEGYTLINFFASYDLGSVRISAALENVLDTEWNEAQFDTESRLHDETAPVSELHFTPGNPRNIRIGLSYVF